MAKKKPCVPCEKRKEALKRPFVAARNLIRRIVQGPAVTSDPVGGAPEGAWRPGARRTFKSDGE